MFEHTVSNGYTYCFLLANKKPVETKLIAIVIPKEYPLTIPPNQPINERIIVT